MAGRGATTFTGVEFQVITDERRSGAPTRPNSGTAALSGGFSVPLPTMVTGGQFPLIRARLCSALDLRVIHLQPSRFYVAAGLAGGSVGWGRANNTLHTEPAQGTRGENQSRDARCARHGIAKSASNDQRLGSLIPIPDWGSSSLLKGAQTSLPVSIRELGRQADLAFRERMNRGASTLMMAGWDDHGTLGDRIPQQGARKWRARSRRLSKGCMLTAETLLILTTGPGLLRSSTSDRALDFSGCLDGFVVGEGPGLGIGSNSDSKLTSCVVLWRIGMFWITSTDRERETMSAIAQRSDFYSAPGG
ncbi:hypothetical protein R1flu_024242 [Riccia fluitans]|uniref:Uncharacterized protein n=1 Tax=Riccia fluitans TaxID=41844 RepID=A0ABD1XUR7_9MARC